MANDEVAERRSLDLPELLGSEAVNAILVPEAIRLARPLHLLEDYGRRRLAQEGAAVSIRLRLEDEASEGINILNRTVRVGQGLGILHVILADEFNEAIEGVRTIGEALALLLAIEGFLGIDLAQLVIAKEAMRTAAEDGECRDANGKVGREAARDLDTGKAVLHEAIETHATLLDDTVENGVVRLDVSRELGRQPCHILIGRGEGVNLATLVDEDVL